MIVSRLFSSIIEENKEARNRGHVGATLYFIVRAKGL